MNQRIDRDLFVFESKPLAGARVASIRGREALSEPFRFDVGLVTTDEVDDAQVVGAKATLTTSLDDGAGDYRWHGIVAELDLLHAVEGAFVYRAVLVPRLWRLGMSLHSRVFVETSTPDILRQIFELNGLTDYTLKLSGDYPPHPHVCQYRESDLAFISRWMEREGLYYYFDHQGSTDELVITDCAMFHDSLRSEPVRYDPRALEDASAGEALHALSSKRVALPEAVELRDYDHLKPALDVAGDQQLADGVAVRQRLIGENFTTPAEGKRLATVRSEELACRRTVYRGAGHILRLRPGYRFDVDNHPCRAFNASLLCTALEHRANLGAADPTLREVLEVDDDTIYKVTLSAIPADMQFRAERKTPKPRIYGVERATIDGPTDSPYAQLDDHGRYKLKIHFDESDLRDGKASTWVRMLQPHGGETEGFHFPLRKGTEVMLTFQGGDPDQPVIAGVAPNALKTNPVTEDNATWNEIRTGGDNCMRFNDKKDEECIDVRTPYAASRFTMGFPLRVMDFGEPPHDVWASVYLGTKGTAAFDFGTDWEIQVGARKKEFVKGLVAEEYGVHQTHVVAARDEKVDGPVTLAYGSGLTETIDGRQSTTVSGNRWDEVGGSVTLDWGATQGRMASLNLSIPGGATLTTPTWKIVNPDESIFGAVLTGSWAKKVEIVGGKYDHTAFKVASTNVYMSFDGFKGSQVGVYRKIEGVELSNGSVSAWAKGVRVLTAGLVNMT